MKVLLAATAFVFAGPVALAALFTGPSSAMTAPSAAARAEIPADLLPVYMAASVTCDGLPWQVLAAIGWVESRHADRRADPHSGDVEPPIIGVALDGQNGTATIRDASQPDGWAHALGPMQFLPTTWTMLAFNNLMIRDLPPISALWPSLATVTLGVVFLAVGLFGASRLYD